MKFFGKLIYQVCLEMNCMRLYKYQLIFPPVLFQEGKIGQNGLHKKTAAHFQIKKSDRAEQPTVLCTDSIMDGSRSSDNTDHLQRNGYGLSDIKSCGLCGLSDNKSRDRRFTSGI